MGDADKDARNEAGREEAPAPQEELGKYGDKPKGRLSGTGRPPVEEGKAGRDGKALAQRPPLYLSVVGRHEAGEAIGGREPVYPSGEGARG